MPIWFLFPKRNSFLGGRCCVQSQADPEGVNHRWDEVSENLLVMNPLEQSLAFKAWWNYPSTSLGMKASWAALGDSCLQMVGADGFAEVSGTACSRWRGLEDGGSGAMVVVRRAGQWSDPFPCKTSREKEMFYGEWRERADPCWGCQAAVPALC